MNRPSFRKGGDLDELRKSAKSGSRTSTSMITKRPDKKDFDKDYLASFVPEA